MKPLNLSKEEKIKIIARGFFGDNQDQYENYREAEVEMTTEIPDDFVETYCEMTLSPKDGHKLFMGHEGHLAYVRMEDGFFEPLTYLTEEEAEEFYARFQERMAVVPDYVHPLEVLAQLGWKEILFEEENADVTKH